MITFEEAIKELKISQETLKGASCGSTMQIVSISREVNDVVDFLRKHRDCDIAIHGYSVDILFRDNSVKSFYPLVAGAKVTIACETPKLCTELWNVMSSSHAPTPSPHEQETDKRLVNLWTILGADDITTTEQYTEFGKGARAALEAISSCNDSQESKDYIQEIKTKSFKKIYKKINTDSGLCPLCGSKNISFTGSEWDHDKYYDDAECGNCGAKWTLNYKYAFKSCVADSNGTTIIPTNQEVSE